MIRTIEEMQQDDKFNVHHCSVSDTLAFCIVAGDYLRAKRRRFSLGTTNEMLNDFESDTTLQFRRLFRAEINYSEDNSWPERVVPYFYANTGSSDYFYLFSMEKEYVE